VIKSVDQQRERRSVATTGSTLDRANDFLATDGPALSESGCSRWSCGKRPRS
jgi:hypothetical protein